MNDDILFLAKFTEKRYSDIKNGNLYFSTLKKFREDEEKKKKRGYGDSGEGLLRIF